MEPLTAEGKDDETNLAVTHASCNRSKQAANLRVARVLARFSQIQDACQADEDRGANLSDVLRHFDGAKHPLKFSIEGRRIRYSFAEIGDNTVRTADLCLDKLSGIHFSSPSCRWPICTTITG